MKRRFINLNPRDWLILCLALGVTAIHASLLLVDEYQNYYARELLIHGFGRVLAVYLMILAWRVRKTAGIKALGCSIASMLLLMLSDYYYEEYIFQALLFLLSPVCLTGLYSAFQNRFRRSGAALALAAALWLAAAAGACLLFCHLGWTDVYDLLLLCPLLLAAAAVSLWLYLRRDVRRQTALLRWWAVCLLLDLWILNEYTIEYALLDTCWFCFLEAGLPFLLVQLLRLLKRKLRAPWLSGGVFFLCALALFLCEMSNPQRGPSREMYYMALPLFVYTIEGAKGRGRACPHILRAGYALLCGGLTFAVNERLRTVLYHLGGPAIQIPAQPRVDWLGYRLAGLRSFFTGSVEPYEELLGYPGFGNHYAYLISDDMGATVFGYGWWWLAIMLALVTLVSVLLLRTKWLNPSLNRCKNCFAFDFLLRAAINLPAALCMYPVSGVLFPFALFPMMDQLWLWLLFEKNAAHDPGGAYKPPVETASAAR